MKITVDLPESDLAAICRITGIPKKGPAIRKMVEDALMLERRKEISAKFLSGEWSAGLAGFEEGRAAERGKARRQGETWRS